VLAADLGQALTGLSAGRFIEGAGAGHRNSGPLAVN
jgi:hypothetical protein